MEGEEGGGTSSRAVRSLPSTALMRGPVIASSLSCAQSSVCPMAAAKNTGYRAVVLLQERIYHPGDVLQGEVVLELDRTLFCDELFATFLGEVRVFWTENKVPPPPSSRTLSWCRDPRSSSTPTPNVANLSVNVISSGRQLS